MTNEISDRFTTAYNYLIKEELVADNKSFAKAIGVSPSLITEITKGRSNVGVTAIQNIVLVYGISSEWLLTGHGKMTINDTEDKKNLPKATRTTKPSKGIPLIPLDAVAGFPATDNEGVYMEDCDRYSIPEFEAKGANFLIRVSGDSMNPLYNNGDIIACRKIESILFFQWGSIYVLDTSQGVLVKYVEECEGSDECVLCVSENTRFKPFRLPKDDIRSLSTIIGLVRLA